MKGLRRLLLVAAATAGLVLSLTGCSKTVDFLQYADVTFDGLNGQATATVNVDYNKIGTDVFGKGKSQTNIKKIPDAFQHRGSSYAFFSSAVFLGLRRPPLQATATPSLTR